MGKRNIYTAAQRIAGASLDTNHPRRFGSRYVTSWTRADVLKVALTCATRREFYKKFSGAVKAALRLGCWDAATVHMPKIAPGRGRYIRTEWHSQCMSVAQMKRPLAERHKPRGPMPQRVRDKLAVARRGTKLSPATIAKIAAKNRGRKRTPETCARISAALRGRALSFELRHRLSIALKNSQSYKAEAERRRSVFRQQTPVGKRFGSRTVIGWAEAPKHVKNKTTYWKVYDDLTCETQIVFPPNLRDFKAKSGMTIQRRRDLERKHRTRSKDFEKTKILLRQSRLSKSKGT